MTEISYLGMLSLTNNVALDLGILLLLDLDMLRLLKKTHNMGKLEAVALD